MNKEILAFVIDQIADSCSGHDSQLEIDATTVISSLPLDSLGILELVYKLENHYEVTVDDHALINAVTLFDLAIMVEKAMADSAQSAA